MLYKGQKVVCVEDNEDTKACGIHKGAVYTIAHVDDRFVGIVEARVTGGWYAWRFRPVHETNITVFTDMLEKFKRGVKANA